MQKTTLNQKGFTLIELMIVVAIIGILASVALPAYSTHTTRARISEGLLALSVCRVAVSEAYQLANNAVDMPGEGNFGCECGIADVFTIGDDNNCTQYVSSITTNVNGVATVEMRGIVGDGVEDGDEIRLVPQFQDEDATAEDHAGKVITGFDCKPGANEGSQVKAKFLPTSCK